MFLPSPPHMEPSGAPFKRRMSPPHGVGTRGPVCTHVHGPESILNFTWLHIKTVIMFRIASLDHLVLAVYEAAGIRSCCLYRSVEVLSPGRGGGGGVNLSTRSTSDHSIGLSNQIRKSYSARTHPSTGLFPAYNKEPDIYNTPDSTGNVLCYVSCK